MSPQIAAATHYYRWIHAAIRPWLGERVLEVGPGYGNLAQLLLAEGRRYTGVDLDAGVIDALRARLSPPSPDALELVCGDVRTPALRERLADAHHDTVLSFNVLEHLADREAHLRALRDAAAPSATLVLFVPAMPAIYGTLDEQAGHYLRFRREELRELVARVAEPLELGYFNGVGALTWFAAGRVLRLPLDGEATNGAIGVYDRFVVPVARRLDPLLARWFGQSLLCHARFRRAS